MRQRLQDAITPLRKFLETEAAGGIALLIATAAAMLWTNSPFGASYERIWQLPFPIGFGPLSLELDLRHWINAGLMTFFFFVVGLEVKRELVAGELRDPRKAALPIAGAIGGMLAPALVYLAFTGAGPAARGWGIPMATDIAFVVGVLALLGSRVPTGLKIFLLSLAIVDDIGAILVIALFYSSGIVVPALGVAALAIVAFARLWSIPGWQSAAARVALAIAVWLAVHASGVHATIAGVALALAVPADRGNGPVARLEHALHLSTSYFVVPLFALANAGVTLSLARIVQSASAPVGMGIILGLLVGKTIGITAASLLACRIGVATPAEGVTWRALGASAVLAGIGFTVSLFIADLAFTDAQLIQNAKIAIFCGSAVAAIVGAALLALVLRRDRAVGIP